MPSKDMTLEDLKDSLIKNGRRHRWYFHYTTSSVLEKMLKSNQLWLSSLERMNDGNEAKLRTAKSTFAVCFSFGREESVAMWNTYGIPRREAVRLCFDGVLFRKWLTARQKDEKPHLAMDFDGNLIDKIPACFVTIRLQDIAYAVGDKGNILYREELITVVDKGKQIKAKSSRLASFVKMGGWSYEREVRLVVKIADNYTVPDMAYVALDFSPVMKCLLRKRKIQNEYPIVVSPWASTGKKELMKKNKLLVRESSFTGSLDNLKTICDKCDVKTKACCKCRHKGAR